MPERARSDAAGGPGRSLTRSFAFRLGAAFAVVAILASALAAAVANAAVASRFDRYLSQQQSSQVGQIRSVLERAYTQEGMWDEDVLWSVVPLLGAGTLRVLDAEGSVVFRWPLAEGSMADGDRDEGASPSPSPPQGSTGGWDHDGDQGGWDDEGGWGSGQGESGWRMTSYPLAAAAFPVSLLAAASSDPELGPAQRISIRAGGGVVGTAIVRLPRAETVPDAASFRSDVVRWIMLGGLLAALLSLGLGIVFALRATTPVRRMTGTARAFAAGDRSVHLETERPDEFGEVERALSSMAETVDQEERLRQGFAAEVAHELRTPLTILRSQVEGLRVGVLEPTPEAMVSLHEEVLRISRLVSDLQILGSADAAGFSLDRATTDLQEVVDEAVREFAGLFEGSEIRIETRLEPVQAWVDRIRWVRSSRTCSPTP